MTIYLDMDGTIADLYGDPNWLAKLIASDASVYAEAKPLARMFVLARYLNRLQKRGYRIGIISWLSKSGTEQFNAEVAKVKRDWLTEHLPSVKWDEIHIIPYGVPKSTCATDAISILFDDEQNNRSEWADSLHNPAFGEEMLLEILRYL